MALPRGMGVVRKIPVLFGLFAELSNGGVK